jgi:hypothetical protein
MPRFVGSGADRLHDNYAFKRLFENANPALRGGTKSRGMRRM